jgi:pyrroloquinoline quinone biosynthesis protein B
VARSGKILPQLQSCIAIAGDDNRWFLINASPDLPQQIERTPGLQPGSDSFRNTPISGVFLTNADLDHSLGLVLMRQQEKPPVVFASDDTRAALRWIELILQPFGGIEWRIVAPDFESFCSSIAFRALPLGNSLAFQFRDEISGAIALIAPAVGKITDELQTAIHQAEAVFFDGTFWSNEELRTVRPGARTAREMNHLPISEGSLDLLRQAPARRKIYTHINNTNPILSPDSPERTTVEQAGVEIGRDGLEIIL